MMIIIFLMILILWCTYSAIENYKAGNSFWTAFSILAVIVNVISLVHNIDKL